MIKPNSKKMSIPDRIILVAGTMPSEFAAGYLVEKVWLEYPLDFCLEGCSKSYPDSNKVLSALLGTKGMVAKGWLMRVRPKTYAVTALGRRRIAQLKGEPEVNGKPGAVQLEPTQDRYLSRLLYSAAVNKFERCKTELTFDDACKFWNVAPAANVDAQLKVFERHIDELDHILSLHDAELAGGRIVTAGDVRALANMSRYLTDRFSRHLSLLRSRKGDK